jgi:hypothetical protein
MTDTPEFQAHLREISRNARDFYDKIEKWIKQDGLEHTVKLSPGYVSAEYIELARQHNLAKNIVVKKYISSTHNWIEGKARWSKKRDNWFQSPYECTVCRMGGSGHDEVGWAGEMEEVTDIPTRDMHGHLISRTCAEVLAAREEYRKKRKGTKCYQCGTYGCLFKGV